MSKKKKKQNPTLQCVAPLEIICLSSFLGQFWFPQLEMSGWSWWAEARDVVKHPTMSRTAPMSKNYPVQDNKEKTST